MSILAIDKLSVLLYNDYIKVTARKEQLMHKIENILVGIGLILFGIASILLVRLTDWMIFELLGVIAPIIGIIVVIAGAIYEGKD